MKKFNLSIVILTLVLLTGCQTLADIKDKFRNEGVGVGQNNTVTAHNNLSTHSAIALFQSQEGAACYDLIKEAIEFSLASEDGSDFVGATEPKVATVYDAMIAQSKAMTVMTESFMKNTADIVAYSNGITPQDPIVQLATLCKRNNYYDMQMAKSENRNETLRSIAAEVTDFLKVASPYAVLGYVGSKVGTRSTIVGDNNAHGDGNRVSTPTTVKPEVVVVETDVVVFPPTEPPVDPEL